MATALNLNQITNTILTAMVLCASINSKNAFTQQSEHVQSDPKYVFWPSCYDYLADRNDAYIYIEFLKEPHFYKILGKKLLAENIETCDVTETQRLSNGAIGWGYFSETEKNYSILCVAAQKNTNKIREIYHTTQEEYIGSNSIKNKSDNVYVVFRARIARSAEPCICPL